MIRLAIIINLNSYKFSAALKHFLKKLIVCFGRVDKILVGDNTTRPFFMQFLCYRGLTDTNCGIETATLRLLVKIGMKVLVFINNKKLIIMN